MVSPKVLFLQITVFSRKDSPFCSLYINICNYKKLQKTWNFSRRTVLLKTFKSTLSIHIRLDCLFGGCINYIASNNFIKIKNKIHQSKRQIRESWAWLKKLLTFLALQFSKHFQFYKIWNCVRNIFMLKCPETTNHLNSVRSVLCIRFLELRPVISCSVIRHL